MKKQSVWLVYAISRKIITEKCVTKKRKKECYLKTGGWETFLDKIICKFGKWL